MTERRINQESKGLSLTGAIMFFFLATPFLLFPIYIGNLLFFSGPEVAQHTKEWLIITTLIALIPLIILNLLSRMLGSLIAIWIIIIQSILNHFKKMTSVHHE